MATDQLHASLHLKNEDGYQVSKQDLLVTREEQEEVFKDIKNYEGIYEVSNYGAVRTKHRTIIRSDGQLQTIKTRIRKSACSNGYLRLGLVYNNTRKYYSAHRLVAIAFLPNPHNLPQVNHKDGIKSNNKVGNLEWATAKYNTRHAIDNGMFKIRRGINISKSRSVIDYLLGGFYATIKDWCKARNIGYDSGLDIVNHKRKSKAFNSHNIVSTDKLIIVS